MIYIDYKYFYR